MDTIINRFLEIFYDISRIPRAQFTAFEDFISFDRKLEMNLKKL